MDGTKSKFDYEHFYGYPDYCNKCFVINRAKYSIEQARAIFESEYEKPPIVIKEATVRFGAGIDEDGERQVGWWVDWDANDRAPRRCPVWVMR